MAVGFKHVLCVIFIQYSWENDPIWPIFFIFFQRGWKPTSNSRNVWTKTGDLGRYFQVTLWSRWSPCEADVSLVAPTTVDGSEIRLTSWELLTKNISVYLREKIHVRWLFGTSGPSTVWRDELYRKFQWTIFHRRTQESGIHITECFFRISDS